MMTARHSLGADARPQPRRGIAGRLDKVFRDPVYGNISVTHAAVLDVIDSPEFQRLRRIHQLGMCHTVYYGAEHSRFQHSIGASWLMHRILLHWREHDLVDMSDEVELCGTLAALLHDVGHGPFSHALEHVFSNVHHEAIGRRIIGERLAPLLRRHGVDVDCVLGILDGSAGLNHLSELISSQIDVDRMDYLLRDSLYAGVRYGLYDIDRIVYTLVPIETDEGLGLAFDVKGIHAAEEYLFSRYSMYWQVYFHKTTRSCEALLKAVLQRAHDVAEQSRAQLYIPPNLEFMYEPRQARSAEQWLDAFLAIDDTDLTHAIKLWRASSDKVLADLADRFINRRLFKAVPVPLEAEDRIDEVRRLVEREYGEATPYYFHVDRPAGSAYDYYTAAPGKPVIRVLTEPTAGWEEISQVTQTQAVRALGQVVTRSCVLLPASCAADAHRLLHKKGSLV